MRGFISGLIVGVMVVGAGLVGLSLSVPLAPRPDVGSVAPSGAPVAPPAPAASGVAAAGTDPDVVEAAPGAPQGASRSGDDVAGLTEADMTPPKAPVVTGAPEVPDVTAETGQAVTPGAEMPTVAPPPADAPQAPVADAGAALPAGTATSAAAPQVADSAPVTATPAAPVDDAAVAVADMAPVKIESQGEAPAAPAAVDLAPVADQSAARPDASVVAEAAPKTRAATGGEMPELPTPSATPPATGHDATGVATPADDPAPEVSQAPAEAPAEPVPAVPAPDVAETLAEPAVPGTGTVPVVISRPDTERSLPVIVQTPDTDTDTGQVAPRAESGSGLPQAGLETTALAPRIGQRVVPLTERNATSDAGATGASAAGTPLERYGEPLDNPEGRPLMAIVLIDDAESIGVEALREFPYPLTFALDPTAPDAAAKMARHRANGFEVVALVDLPRGAAAQDAEVALAASFDRLDQAVAVLEGIGTGVQDNRSLSDQVTAFVGGTGRGLITQGNGLNTMLKLALRDRVPAAAVFRDFDGAGQTPSVMRRFLDQAAFRAGQEGAVVMLGRVRPDTVSALLLWGLQDRASRVALAPVSAVLKQSVSPQ